MNATAPITQDVLTLPRKLPEGGLMNLVGLSRDQLRAAELQSITDSAVSIVDGFYQRAQTGEEQGES